MNPTDDVAALEAAGYEVVGRCWPNGGALDESKPGDLIVRRKRRPPVAESECVRMFYNALLRDRDYRAERVEELAAFRAALAREVLAGYQQGFADAERIAARATERGA